MLTFMRRLSIVISNKSNAGLDIPKKGFKGKTERDITVGNVTQGTSWGYDAQGIVFQLRDRKVVSWILLQKQ